MNKYSARLSNQSNHSSHTSQSQGHNTENSCSTILSPDPYTAPETATDSKPHSQSRPSPQTPAPSPAKQPSRSCPPTPAASPDGQAGNTHTLLRCGCREAMYRMCFVAHSHSSGSQPHWHPARQQVLPGCRQSTCGCRRCPTTIFCRRDRSRWWRGWRRCCLLPR